VDAADIEPLQSGTTFGRYRIVRMLGRGGMGEVYEAVHTELDKRVALKTMRRHVELGESSISRFIREGQAAARVHHPNVVEIFDVGSEGDVRFLVMQYVEGETLAARYRRGFSSIAELVDLFLPILSAVATAHDAGVIHRDLKPDNVMLARFPHGEERPMVLDFGISKLIGGDTPDSDLTATSDMMGTPYYMSPEQARGAKEVDARADQYTLGVMLYEGLTGQRPFLGDQVLEVLFKITSHDFVAPRQVRADLPEALEAVILRAMALDRDARYPDLLGLAQALLPFAGEAARSRWGQSVSREPMLDQPTLMGAADTLPSGQAPVVDGSPTTTLSSQARERESDPVELPGAGKGGRLALIGGGIVGLAMLGGVLLTAEPEPAAPQPVSAVSELRQPVVGHRQIASYRSRRDYVPSESAWQAAARDLEQASEQLDAPVRWKAEASFAQGMEALAQGHAPLALEAFDAAVMLEPNLAVGHVGRAAALSQLRRPDEAVQAAQTAERIEPNFWLAIAAGASALSANDRVDDAIQEYRRALTIAPSEPELLSSLALTYHVARLDSEAVRYAELALKADPERVSARLLLAERALERSDGKLALEHADRAVAVSTSSTAARLAQADALALLGRKADARAAYDRTLELAEKFPDSGAPKERLEQVRSAIAKDRMPAPRVTRDEGRPARARSKKPTGRSAPRSRRSGRSSAGDPLQALDF